jgi:uncharacterized integral membrane protein
VVEERYEDRRDRNRRVSPKLVIWAVVALLAVVLIAQNSRKARIDILFWDVTAGLWFILLIVFGLGVLLGFLLPRLRRNKTQDD